jgi:hypothetical protein
MFRREFIRLASLAAGAVPFSKSVRLSAAEQHGIDVSNARDKNLPTDELLRLFQNPPNPYRPMVRWWWNGDRISADEITRELDVLQRAGIGGVEINPIKFPAEADPLNTKALTWMSDEWIAVLKVALQGCKERGMTCDMIVGSGWPYGGEFLARQDQTQMMAIGTREFSGPQHVRLTSAELLADVSPRFVSPYKDPLKELFALTLVPYELESANTAVPVEEKRESNVVEFDVPAGRHVLYFLVRLTGFMAVINGAPGASGPVLNHYSAPSVTRYLDRISDRLSSTVGPLGQHFRAFFTDSIELEGANWCDDMLSEFRRRRGYDLAPYLPFVLFKVGEMGNAVADASGARFSPDFLKQTQLVRYDFETTKHELFRERFVSTFVNWCTRVGVKSRMQAYGMDCDPIAAGMMLDIPESETWIRSEEIQEFGSGDYTHGRSYTMINKFVSSAAHLSGKRLISCEEMTNTDDPFHASMERIKVAGDQSMLSGVTQSVLHGFNYSPPAVPFPGWVRYGTYFSERNSWWPYFRYWTTYKARLSALFQHADMQADIAILPPEADLASRYGFQRDPFPRIAYPPYLYKLWEVVHQNGSGCDYISEEIIAKSTVKGGRLVFRDRSYKAILMPAVESIQPATAEQLQSFVASGGTIIFIDKTPHLASGLADQAANSSRVLDVISTMRKSCRLRTPLLPVNESEMVTWYRDLQEHYALQPYVVISTPTDFISQIHYRTGAQEIFFFTHYGPQERQTFEAKFNTGDKVAWLWDTESGVRTPYRTTEKKNVLTISLEPSESKLIVFESPTSSTEDRENAHHPVPHREGPIAASQDKIIPGPWDVKFEHVDGTERTIVLEDLVDFNEREELKSFAGTIIYRKQLSIDKTGAPLWLNLGHVHAISELAVNGHDLGVRWYGEHLYDVSSAVAPGLNNISIKVVTTLGNYMKTLKDNPTAHAWTSNTPFYPLGLIHPVRLVTGK